VINWGWSDVFGNTYDPLMCNVLRSRPPSPTPPPTPLLFSTFDRRRPTPLLSLPPKARLLTLPACRPPSPHPCPPAPHFPTLSAERRSGGEPVVQVDGVQTRRPRVGRHAAAAHQVRRRLYQRNKLSLVEWSYSKPDQRGAVQERSKNGATAIAIAAAAAVAAAAGPCSATSALPA
jgi:hypothetical protein